MLQRVQLMIDDQTRLDLATLARWEGRSVSDLAREFLSEKIRARKISSRTAKKTSAVKVMLDMVKTARKFATRGPHDLARNHDQHLY